MRKIINLSGKTFHQLTVINQAPNRNGRVHWNCICKCGNDCVVMSKHIISGQTKSCGCLVKHNSFKKHDMTNTPEYRTWAGMIQRCTNPNNDKFKFYGGRGITVCDKWFDSSAFFKDMGKKPTPEHTLDRIDNSKGYSKENCRWATMKTQSNNTRRNLLATINGVTLTASQWANKTGISRHIICSRIHKGLSGNDVIKPVKKSRWATTFYTYKNESKTINQWAKCFGLSVSMMKQRIILGWTIKDAIEVPVRHLNPRHNKM